MDEYNENIKQSELEVEDMASRNQVSQNINESHDSKGSKANRINL